MGKPTHSNFILNHFEALKERLITLRSFLNRYRPLWDREVLNYYPESLQAFPSNWIQEIGQFSLDDLYELDGKQEFQHLPDGAFKSFVQECRGLEQFPILPVQEKDYPTWAWYGVKGKKKHEIMRLTPLISKYCQQKQLTGLIDIGGGVGHLARILAHYEGIPVTSVDINPKLQEKGKAREKKYPKPEGHQALDFYCCQFNQQFALEHLEKISNSDKQGMIGLHTCGNLANDFLKTMIATDIKMGVNLGCCYLKLDPKKETSLSQVAKTHPLIHTKYSLTLATRGHLKLSREEFDYKLKVKKYRYLLHLFFLEHGLTRFVSVGDSPPRDYALPFAGYVNLKIKEAMNKEEIPREIAKRLQAISDEEKNDFFAQQKRQDIFWQLFQCDLIRWQVGRLLELDIVLDRALYAYENGLEAQAFQIFDEEKSPRNIALVYTRK